MQLAELLRAAKRVYVCGNGGSAANAIHLANDWIAAGVKAYPLTADIATLTATANDFSYAAVFALPLKVLAAPGDLLVVLSGSGHSANIIKALETAKELGITSIAIIGAFNENTPAEALATHTIKHGHDMQAAETAQIILGHEAMRELNGDTV